MSPPSLIYLPIVFSLYIGFASLSLISLLSHLSRVLHHVPLKWSFTSYNYRITFTVSTWSHAPILPCCLLPPRTTDRKMGAIRNFCFYLLPFLPPSHPHCFPSSSPPCPFARTLPAWNTPQGMSGHFTATVLTLQLNFLIESMTCDGKVRCKKESTHHSIPQDVNEGPATLGDLQRDGRTVASAAPVGAVVWPPQEVYRGLSANASVALSPRSGVWRDLMTHLGGRPHLAPRWVSIPTKRDGCDLGEGGCTDSLP